MPSEFILSAVEGDLRLGSACVSLGGDGALATANFVLPSNSLQFVYAPLFMARMKPIRLSDHALRYATKRGFTVDEVEDAIRTAAWQAAELGRLECRKDLAYGKEWNGKFYGTKQVRPVFVEEAGEIVVVTVYTYYF